MCHRYDSGLSRGHTRDSVDARHGAQTGPVPSELRDRDDRALDDEVVWGDTDEEVLLKKCTCTGGRDLLVPAAVSRAKREEVADESVSRVSHCGCSLLPIAFQNREYANIYITFKCWRPAISRIAIISTSFITQDGTSFRILKAQSIRPN